MRNEIEDCGMKLRDDLFEKTVLLVCLNTCPSQRKIAAGAVLQKFCFSPSCCSPWNLHKAQEKIPCFFTAPDPNRKVIAT